MGGMIIEHAGDIKTEGFNAGVLLKCEKDA